MPVHDKTDFNADAYFRWRKYYPYCAAFWAIGAASASALDGRHGQSGIPHARRLSRHKNVHSDAGITEHRRAIVPNKSRFWPSSPAA